MKYSGANLYQVAIKDEREAARSERGASERQEVAGQYREVRIENISERKGGVNP